MASIACVLLGATVISLSFHLWSSDWESVIPAKNDGSLFEIFNFNYAYACVSVFQFVPINIGTCRDQKGVLDPLEMKLNVLVIPFLWESNSKEQWFFVLFCFNSLAISPTQRITPFKSLWQYLKNIVKMYRFSNI